jgi:peptidoglycan/xylan/chitin deacetylase (PgdA/CDA1 family)
LIRIGCHTKNHRSLSDLSPLEVEREVNQAQRALEAVVGRPLRAFSYPYGRVDEAAERVVRRAGFALACSSRPAAVTPLANRWRLPRLQVTDRSGDQFASQLSAYLPRLRPASA